MFSLLQRGPRIGGYGPDLRALLVALLAPPAHVQRLDPALLDYDSVLQQLLVRDIEMIGTRVRALDAHKPEAALRRLHVAALAYAWNVLDMLTLAATGANARQCNDEAMSRRVAEAMRAGEASNRATLHALREAIAALAAHEPQLYRDLKLSWELVGAYGAPTAAAEHSRLQAS